MLKYKQERGNMEDTIAMLEKMSKKLEKQIGELKSSSSGKQSEIFSLYALQNAIRHVQKELRTGKEVDKEKITIAR